MNAKTQAFLRALEALCREHDATIGGCGCCDSPYVAIGSEDIGNVRVLVGEVWIYPKGEDCEKVQLDKPTLVIDGEPFIAEDPKVSP